MSLAADLAVALVALLHAAFFVLEAFLWTRPLGRRVFGQTREAAAATRVLALNQGAYNLVLAAGLAWGLARGGEGAPVVLFLLGGVLAVGIVGGLTASRAILLVQALPAALALALLWLARGA